MTTGPRLALALALAASLVRSAAAEEKAVGDQEVRQVVDGHMGDLKACMQSHGAATGKLVVEFTILPDGKVSDSKVGTASSNRALDACIAGGFKRWTFPKPRNGKAWLTAYPITFSEPKPPAKGTLTEAEIQKVVHGKMAEVQACLAEARKEKSDVAGAIDLGIAVSAAGAVVDVKILKSTTKAPKLDACVTGKVKAWPFPKPKGGGEAAFRYPLSFEPKAEGKSESDE